VVLVQTTILATGERDHATDDCDRIGSDVHPNVEQHGYDMTPPLPKPDLEDHPHELWGQNVCSDFVTVEKMRAYGEARAAAERERICAAIQAEDDHCANFDYMLDSKDCIAVARGEWVAPVALEVAK